MTSTGSPITKRGVGSHGVPPLSASTRKRLLKALLDKAEAGDVPAAEALIRLSLLNERVKKASAAADQLLLGGGAVA